MSKSVEKLLAQMSLVKPPDSPWRADQAPDGFPTRSRRKSAWTTAVLPLFSAAAGLMIGVSLPAVDFSNPESDMARTSRPHIALAELVPVGRADVRPPVELEDDGLFLLNGVIPVRKYRATSWYRFKAVDRATGQEQDIEMPVRQIVVAAVRDT